MSPTKTLLAWIGFPIVTLFSALMGSIVLSYTIIKMVEGAHQFSNIPWVLQATALGILAYMGLTRLARKLCQMEGRILGFLGLQAHAVSAALLALPIGLSLWVMCLGIFAMGTGPDLAVGVDKVEAAAAAGNVYYIFVGGFLVWACFKGVAYYKARTMENLTALVTLGVMTLTLNGFPGLVNAFAGVH